jgi:hypothetical protein
MGAGGGHIILVSVYYRTELFAGGTEDIETKISVSTRKNGDSIWPGGSVCIDMHILNHKCSISSFAEQGTYAYTRIIRPMTTLTETHSPMTASKSPLETTFLKEEIVMFVETMQDQYSNILLLKSRRENLKTRLLAEQYILKYGAV